MLFFSKIDKVNKNRVLLPGILVDNDILFEFGIWKVESGIVLNQESGIGLNLIRNSDLAKTNNCVMYNPSVTAMP